MKLLLEIQNDIVVRARHIEDFEVSQSTKDTPYYSGNTMTLNSIGNRYAESLRKRDSRISNGDRAEVILLSSGDIDDYILKKKTADGYENDGENDETRIHRAKMKEAMYVIEQYDSLIGMIPDPSAIDVAYGEGSWDSLVSIAKNNESISDIWKWESLLNSIDEENKLKFIFCFARHMAASREEKLREHAIRWFEKLIGTKEEVRAYTWIASIYAYADEPDLAVGMYKKMLKIKGLSESDRAKALERIEYIGCGKSIYEEAYALFNDGQYEAGMQACDRFEKCSTGRTKVIYGEKIKRIKGKCYGKLGRNQQDIAKVEIAKDILSEPIKGPADTI